MKCRYCGGEVGLEEKTCPYCGRPNEQAVKHHQNMASFRRRYAETEAEVATKTRRYAQEEDYAGMVREYYHRNYDIAPFPTPQEEEYHVAEYADAAFQDLFFRTVGDREMSARLEDRMKTAREQCGMLSVSADDVDELLKGISLYPQN